MSTIFDVRNIRLPKMSRTTVIIGSLIVVVALVVGYVGYRLYEKLTNNTVVAYFPAANALYAGDKVQIMGLRVGAIDKIEPAGDKMKVTFHYENKYKVPANASAVILNPTLVASRAIQLEPPYKGGPGAGRQRGDPGGAHPGAGGVGRAAQQHHQHHLQARSHQGAAERARSVRSSRRSPTVWPARASRSTPPSTACRRR